MLEDIADRLEAVVFHLEQTLRLSDVLVSCTEAARHLGVSQTTVSRMLREGRLRKVTIGESTGIRFSEIMDMRPQ